MQLKIRRVFSPLRIEIGLLNSFRVWGTSCVYGSGLRPGKVHRH